MNFRLSIIIALEDASRWYNDVTRTRQNSCIQKTCVLPYSQSSSSMQHYRMKRFAVPKSFANQIIRTRHWRQQLKP